MKVIFVFYLLLSYIVGFSQGMHGAKQTFFLSPMQFDGIYVRMNEKDFLLQDKVYLFSNWEGKNEVYVSEKTRYAVKTLNYNIKTNVLEARISKDSVFQFEIEKIYAIKHDLIEYKKYKINGISKLFQEIYVSDNIKFIKGFFVVINKSVFNPLTQALAEEEGSSIKEKYYLKLNNRDFVEFNLNEKSVLKLLGSKSDEIKKFASNMKLNFKSEADLSKIFSEFDAL